MWWVIGLIALVIAAASFPLWGPYVIVDDEFPGDER